MQYRRLGRTGLNVSTICLGTMTFGNQLNETESIKIIEKALDAGINFFDTADIYAEGSSEEIVGKALKKERHSVVLATKVGQPVASGRMDSAGNNMGLSRKHIMQQIENSLRRLGTDYIDIYYVHTPDYNTPIEVTLRTFDDLVHQGKVRYIACSNFTAWQLVKARWVSARYNLAGFDCIQPPYNLITRDIEYELLPLCKSEGIGVCVYNPLAGGLLTGKYDPNKPPAGGTRFALEHRGLGQIYYDRYWSTANFDAITRLKQIAEQHDRNLTSFALAWTLNNETITSAICGATSIKQLEENLTATELKLSPEELAACDEVWQQFRAPRFFYGR